MNGFDDRSKVILKYNVTGIVMNLILGLSKVVFGSLINAHAIMIDGVNSLSDMTASVVSVFSTFLSNKSSDKKHPLGYGRLEYIASFVITIIIIYIGVMSIIDTIRAIINPHEAPDYNIGVVVLMIVSMIVKLIYGFNARKEGKRIGSIALTMTGIDTLADSFVSIAILGAILIYRITGIDIEHYLCLIISVLVIMTAVRMINECMNKILGTRIDPDFRRKIINAISMEEDVLNVSNLVIHSYGENNYIGSLDIEVDENMLAAEVSKLSRKLIRRAEDLGLNLVSVGISAANISDPKASEMWDKIIQIITRHPEFIRANSFTVDFKEKDLSFYVVENYAIKNREDCYKKLYDEVQKEFPDMHIDIYQGIDM